MKVRVKRLQARPMQQQLILYGKTEPNRQLQLQAQVAGEVRRILISEGAVVSEGQLLVELDPADLPQRLESATALVEQRQLEYRAAMALGRQNLQSETRLAQAKALLAQAKAEQARLQEALANYHIRAPFDGVFNRALVEVGAYVTPGDAVAQLLDLDPLVVRADVDPQSFQQLREAQQATIRLPGRGRFEGRIRYLSRQADSDSSTFRIEIAMANPEQRLPAGLSAEVAVLLPRQQAIRVTPAALALDEEGRIGVKLVRDGRVVFKPVDIVRSDGDGFWLGGLGNEADIIVLGQGFVRAGDAVEAVYDSQAEASCCN